MSLARIMRTRCGACLKLLLLLLPACGHVNFEHEVEIHLENLPPGLSRDGFGVHFDHIYIRSPSDGGEVQARDGYHVAGADGVIRFRHRHGTTAVFGQTGPGSLGFNLHVPGVAEDGWYQMRLRRTFRNRVHDVEGRFVPFGPWPEESSREFGPLPVRARLVPRKPSAPGGPSGYYVTVWLDVSELSREP
jgi:hypothetical protein